MSEEPKDTYGIEPEPDRGPSSASGSVPRVGRPISGEFKGASPGSSEPLPLEDEAPLSQRSVREFDICPNCGASMGRSGEIVCMRCGFDLKTMKQVEVQTGVVEIPHADELERVEGSGREPLIRPGLGELQWPLMVAAIAAAIMLIGYLLGARALFAPVVGSDGEAVANATIGFGMRFMGVLKLVVNVAIITACGLGALRFVAFLLGREVGNWSLAAARMLAISAVLQLPMFIDLKTYSWERMVEFVIQAAILAALALVGLGIKPKDVPTFVGSVAIGYLIVQLGAWIITSIT